MLYLYSHHCGGFYQNVDDVPLSRGHSHQEHSRDSLALFRAFMFCFQPESFGGTRGPFKLTSVCDACKARAGKVCTLPLQSSNELKICL